jgi:hypothetical protein
MITAFFVIRCRKSQDNAGILELKETGGGVPSYVFCTG